MSEPKTKPTAQDPREFLNAVEPREKRSDSFAILEMMERITGEKPVMWGPSIVGFGTYHYKSERSRQEGDWPLIGFSPRKQNLTLYVVTGTPESLALLDRLGKHKASPACLYIKRLADVDQRVLATVIDEAFTHMKRTLTGNAPPARGLAPSPPGPPAS
jgi:hypothetical protein